MRNWKVFISFALVLFFIGCSGGDEGTFEKVVYKDGDRLELTSVAGSKIILLRKNGGFVEEGNEGRILILDIFGTFCVPCQEEAANLMDFQLRNDKDILLVGFTFLEEVTDEYVLENFSKKFNAYYFIVNSPANEKMVNTITADIKYKQSVQVPFKVVLKDAKYQKVTDVYNGDPENMFYIGKIETDVIEKDIEKIKKL